MSSPQKQIGERLIDTESLTFPDYVDEIFSTTKTATDQDSLAPVIEELKLDDTSTYEYHA